MIITDYVLHPHGELFDIVRRAHLAGNPAVRPFERAGLRVQSVSWRDLVPTQAFVLQVQLDKIYDIRTQMLMHGIDVMKMDGFLSYRVYNLPAQFVFTPPIIEVIDGMPLIIDGQHRITFARLCDMPINVLMIEGVAQSVWPYQLPLRGGWDAVQTFQDRLPDGFVRKERRYPNGTDKYYFREYPFDGILKLAREHTGR